MSERLTSPMRDALRKLSDGWELGHGLISATLTFTWLQKGGLGKGGEMQQIDTHTFHALYNRELINQLNKGWHVERWWLTAKGTDAIKGVEKAK